MDLRQASRIGSFRTGTAASAAGARGARPAEASTPTRTLGLAAGAWVATLLLSRLPEIVLREGFGIATPWMPLAVVVLAVGLWLGARAIEAFRPLAGFLQVMVALAVLLMVVPVLFDSPAWTALVPASTHEVTARLAERLVLVIAGLAVVAFVLLTGTRARDAYILPGTVVGRSGLRLPILRQSVRWLVLGPLGLTFLVGLTALVAVSSLPAVVDLEAALPYFGLAVVAALLNSWFEEAAYRAAPMSRLVPAVGPTMAAWLLAVWFGLGHFYGGSPSGPMGAVASTGVGLMFGKAMVATRGIAWPWAWHFAVDLVIFSVMVLASTAPGGGA